jgi:hypothetical protein
MLSENTRKWTLTGSAFCSTKVMKMMAISVSCATLMSRSARWASRFWSWVRSQATRGMSGLSARWALLAARTSSVAVTVGSATESGLAVGRVPGRAFDRIEFSRARALVPAALASEVRVRRPLPPAEEVVLAVLLLAVRRLVPSAALPLVPPLPPLPLWLLLLATVAPPRPPPAP